MARKVNADIEFSPEDGCFFGKLANIRDLVSFEAENARDLVDAFQHAVEDYLASCKEQGKVPNKLKEQLAMEATKIR